MSNYVHSHNMGSSNDVGKREIVKSACAISLCRDEKACLGSQNDMKRNKSIFVHGIVILVKINFRSRYLWALPRIPKRKPSLPKGKHRATGAGCAVRTNGHKTCLGAMASSGSEPRPRRQQQSSQNQPRDSSDIKYPLFALPENTYGPAYFRRTGQTLKELIEDERKKRVKLPPRFGDRAPSELLPSQWSNFGIPVVLLMGLALGRVATEEKVKIPLFQTLLHLVRDQDLDLPLESTLIKIDKLCSAMNMLAATYINRGGTETNDLHSVGPILDKLATSACLCDISAGIQNLRDDIEAANIKGTLRALIDPIAGDPRRNFLDRSAPLYSTRSGKFYEVFNFYSTCDPGNNVFHTMVSLENMALYVELLLRQLALYIRIYNQEYMTVNGKLSISGVVDAIVKLYNKSASAVSFTAPPKAAAMNTVLELTALMDVMRKHVVIKQAFLDYQLKTYGIHHKNQCALSEFWSRYDRIVQDSDEWFGMGSSFDGLSFNVLSVDNDVVWAVRQKNNVMGAWSEWATQVKKLDTLSPGTKGFFFFAPCC